MNPFFLILKILDLKVLYLVGLLIQGIMPFVLVVLVSASIISANQSLVISLIFGLGTGIYWSAKNSLEVLLGEEYEKFKYYFGISLNMEILAGLIFPIYSRLTD